MALALRGLLCALLAAGCKKSNDTSTGGGGGESSGGGVIKVGEFASLTGKEATFGVSSHEGTACWGWSKSTRRAACWARNWTLMTEDDLSKAGEAATAVNKLISRDGVVAILGEVASSRSLEAAPICQQSQIPMISPSSTNPKVTETGDYIFRVCFIDPFQGRSWRILPARRSRPKRWPFSRTSKAITASDWPNFSRKQFLANGGQIVAELDYSGGDKDFKAQLTEIKSAGPDAVLCPVITRTWL
jgi:branched-chain amino acid transport system substrate-binding protein